MTDARTHRPFETLLVANRGEIARRITRTAHALGLRVAVVHTDADADLPFVHEADVAVRIGEGPAATSYLDPERVLDAARRVGAEAVHPGYGFLSESAAFAAAVQEAGLVWVGPPRAALAALGDKAAARSLAGSEGVPVLPGTPAGLDDEALIAAAPTIGAPLLVKATAGGGGRGLRAVHDLAELPAALQAARREAASSFGHDDVILERLVGRARHIEVQLLADAHGHVVHLGERECSVQRRHQKIVEEAPSPAVGPALREQLGDHAVRLARAAGYVGAGTAEFLLDEQGRPWFLEVNARLQVEHPVTEAITGLDLVALQLRIAAGEPLGFTQGDVRLTGHAIELRVVAEDPARDFLPTSGRPTTVRWPGDDGPMPPGVRVDAGYAPGQVVPPHYDGLLAKIVTHGPDRLTATRRARRALEATWVPGLATNLALLRGILNRPAWAQADLHTGFLAAEGLPAPPPLHLARGALAATVLGWLRRRADRPWDVPGEGQLPAGFRLAGPAEQADTWESFGQTLEARWRAAVRDPNRLLVRLGDDEHTVSRARHTAAHGGCEALTLTVDGLTHTWWIAEDGETVFVHFRDGSGEARITRVERLPAPEVSAADPSTLTAPMPGTVVAVHVAPGDALTAGQRLIVLEAMKMEHAVIAPRDGVVERVPVRPGDAVDAGAVLVRLVDEKA